VLDRFIPIHPSENALGIIRASKSSLVEIDIVKKCSLDAYSLTPTPLFSEGHSPASTLNNQLEQVIQQSMLSNHASGELQPLQSYMNIFGTSNSLDLVIE